MLFLRFRQMVSFCFMLNRKGFFNVRIFAQVVAFSNKKLNKMLPNGSQIYIFAIPYQKVDRQIQK